MLLLSKHFLLLIGEFVNFVRVHKGGLASVGLAFTRESDWCGRWEMGEGGVSGRFL